MLLATACGVSLVLRGPDRVFTVALGALLATVLAWILISVLWPSQADRSCPECAHESLRRLETSHLEPASLRGVVCGQCGFEDLERSALLLAEEEGVALEPAVLRDRRREGARARVQTPGWKRRGRA